jgi:hypothetical protein
MCKALDSILRSKEKKGGREEEQERGRKGGRKKRRKGGKEEAREEEREGRRMLDVLFVQTKGYYKGFLNPPQELEVVVCVLVGDSY